MDEQADQGPGREHEVDRRTALKRGATVGALALWTVPAVQSIARPAWAAGSAQPGTATVSGQVTDAQTGIGISGATVQGPSGSTATDSNGFYTLLNVPTGNQSFTASAPGYLSQLRNVVIVAGPNTVNFALAPAERSQILVTLSWGSDPRDLDLHMSGPDGASGRFHAAYYNQNPTPFVSQDVDDVDGNGPENDTITMSAVEGDYVAGRYHVWVHNYTNRTGGGPGFDAGTATVTLTGLTGQILVISEDDVTVGSTSQPIWRGFEFDLADDGTISNVVSLQRFEDGTELSVF